MSASAPATGRRSTRSGRPGSTRGTATTARRGRARSTARPTMAGSCPPPTATASRAATTIAPHAGLRLTHDEPGHVQLSGADYSFSLIGDERPLTEHVHLAFRARED